jgi:hypothetical protein
LLQRGEANALTPFAQGFNRSFDTFGACHAMALPPDLLVRLSEASRVAIAKAPDEDSKNRLVAAGDLFTKLAQGTASEGWVTVAPGTPVTGVRVVWPRWFHKLLEKIRGLFKRNAT